MKFSVVLGIFALVAISSVSTFAQSRSANDALHNTFLQRTIQLNHVNHEEARLVK